MKLPGLATAQALASDWLGALLAVRLGVLTPAPSLVEVTADAIATAPPDVREAARPGYGFGSEYIEHAAGVVGVRALTDCPNHPELLARLVVLDTWIETLDRNRPEFGRNLLIDTGRAGGSREPRLLAVDFGMGFSEVLYPPLGGAPAANVSLVCDERLRSLVDTRSLGDALAEMQSVTEAEIVTMAATAITPVSWIDQAQSAALVRYLLDRRAGVQQAVADGFGAYQ